MPLQGDRPEYWDRAKKELSRNDEVLHEIINEFDDLELVSRGDIFYTLIRSVIGQQISVKAASTVWSRFCLLYTSPSPRDATLSRMPSSA